MIKEAIAQAVAGRDLTAAETEQAFQEIMSGVATPVQVGALLVALRIKGERTAEILGAARAMRQFGVKLSPPPGAPLLDLCGTGGDEAGTFNISTAASFLAAGAGARVAKHGNRGVSSRCGSADVLETLGVRIDAPPERAQQALAAAGMAFLFAPVYHPAMKHAVGPRRQLGLRTIFNVLGPLTNPAGVKCQLLGVYAAEIMRPLAEALRELGADRVLLVRGQDGLDEVSLCGPTEVMELKGGAINAWTLTPPDVGLAVAPRQALRGGDAAQNAEIIKGILDGQRSPRRDAAVLNGGLALVACDLAADAKEGARLAEQSIDNGRAAGVLAELIKISQQP